MTRTLFSAVLSQVVIHAWLSARAESDFHIKGKMATDVRGGGVAVIHKDCWKSHRVNFSA